MNIKIKFKAWDTTEGKWIRNLCFGFTPMVLTDGQGIITVMQFTGLHDKNGKEIYEGDIVKGVFPNHPYRDFDNGLVKWADVRCAFVVEYFKKEIKCYNDLTSCDPDGTVNVETMTDYYMEVIGNKYENHELINK